MEVPDQGASVVEFRWRPSSRLQTADFLLCLHMVEGASVVSGVSWPNHLPFILRDKMSMYESGVGTQKFRPQLWGGAEKLHEVMWKLKREKCGAIQEPSKEKTPARQIENFKTTLSHPTAPWHLLTQEAELFPGKAPYVYKGETSWCFCNFN